MNRDRSDGDTLQTASEVRRGVTRLAWRLRRLRADHGISPAKLALLGRLHRAGGPLTAVALARLESLQPQSLTRLIADLDHAGLILRHRAPDDGRARLISLTDKGADLLKNDAKRQDVWLSGVMHEYFSAAECEFLRLAAEMLARLADITPSRQVL
jgi:DNA-binding MarR family transcriptional regulator